MNLDYQLIYHYNPFTETFYCFDRHCFPAYWNGEMKMNELKGVSKKSFQEARENYLKRNEHNLNR